MIGVLRHRTDDARKEVAKDLSKLESLERRMDEMEEMMNTFSSELKKRAVVSGKSEISTEIKEAVESNKKDIADIKSQLYAMNNKLEDIENRLPTTSNEEDIIEEVNNIIDSIIAIYNSMKVIDKLVERQEKMMDIMKKAVRGIITREDFEKAASSLGKIEYSLPNVPVEKMKPLVKQAHEAKPSKVIPPAKFISKEMPVVEEITIGNGETASSAVSSGRGKSTARPSDSFYSKLNSITSELSEDNISIVKAELLKLLTNKLNLLKSRIAKLSPPNKKVLSLKATQAELGVVSLSSALNSGNVALTKSLLNRIVSIIKEIEGSLD